MKRFVSALISGPIVLSALAQFRAAAETIVLTEAPAIQRGAPTVRFALRQIKEANRKQRLTVTAKYPQAIGHDPRFEKLNSEIKEMMTEQLNTFRKDFQPPEERMGTDGSYFDSTYQVKFATGGVVSIYFNVDTYYEGAAHPNHNSMTFNYSLEEGKSLTLADLFKSNNYLNVISAYAIKDLKKQLGPESDMEWLQKGAGPSKENYQSWNITSKGLLITFDPYQVASYAEGAHEVIVPYSALKGLLKPAGPLSKIAGVHTLRKGQMSTLNSSA